MKGKINVSNELIIKNLYVNKALSSTELSLRIKKSLPVTIQLLNTLLEEGYVIETGYARSTGGRKPVNYAINPGIMYVISVAMDQYVTRIALMNMKNEFLTPVAKYELPLLNNNGALELLIEKIEQVINKSGIPKAKFAGIGIGMPGFVDIKKGLNHTYLFTEGQSIAEYISGKINLPVFIDNDSSIIALAELKFGAARDTKDAMVVNVGWGIGLGLILNGELYEGHNGFAGEFSHIPLLFNGKLCSCGKSGCLETEASLLIVVAKAIEGLRVGQITKLKELPEDDLGQALQKTIKAAHEGDRFAIGLLSESGYTIGRGVAILIHIFNPEFVILSGRGSAAGKILVTPLQQAINEYCIPSLAEHTSIRISELGEDAELIGAAALVMENYEKEEANVKVNLHKIEIGAN
ncbi:MAG: ROK family protein [Ferruginibacter sp.]